MLGQVVVDEKSNEVTAVPALLQLLDVKDAVVSLDAPGGARAAADRRVDP